MSLSDSRQIAYLQDQIKSREEVLKELKAELKELMSCMNLAVARLTVVNTIYNETGKYDMWLPAYTAMIKEIKDLQKSINRAGKRKKKLFDAIQVASANLAIAEERLVQEA